jgi:hypothetical protein
MVIAEFTEIVEGGVSAFEQEGDLAILEPAFPSNIKLLESLLVNDPENSKLHVILARFYGSYGFTFFEGQLERRLLHEKQFAGGDTCKHELKTSGIKARLDRYYSRGHQHALKAMKIKYPNCDTLLNNVRTRESFINSLTPEDIPALFWYGFNLAAYINLNRDSIRAVSRADIVEKAMRKVIATEATYFYGAAHLVLLNYYSSFPLMTGGNPALSLSHYQKMKKISGDDFLIADLYYARYILYKKRSREDFISTLKKIVEFPEKDDKYPLLNRIARMRAGTYLKYVDLFFE